MRASSKRLVSILTDLPLKRHLAGFAVILTLVIPAFTAAADMPDTAWHPVKDITAAAENYLKRTVGSSDDSVVPTAGYLDPRLQLPLCNSALEPFLRPGAKVSGRTIVGVRCAGSNPWKIYLPVYVAVMEEVLISQNSMPRGYLIQPQDVEVATRDISGLVGGYLTQTGDLTGHRLTRAVAKGVVISSSLLRADPLIRSGQTVTLIVRNEALNIRMTGKALMDGAVNQRIKVKNTESGNVVEGLVRSGERVEVLVN